MASRVAHRAEPAHRQPCHSARRPGAVVALEQVAQLAQVEGLPARAVEPVAVEADVAALRHDHEHVAQRGELLDGGLARPAVVGVAAPVQQEEHGPAAVAALRPARGREQPNARVLAERGRADGEIDHPRSDPALVAHGRAVGCGHRRRRRRGRRRARRLVAAPAASRDEQRRRYQSRCRSRETWKPCPRRDVQRMPRSRRTRHVNGPTRLRLPYASTFASAAAPCPVADTEGPAAVGHGERVAVLEIARVRLRLGVVDACEIASHARFSFELEVDAPDRPGRRAEGGGARRGRGEQEGRDDRGEQATAHAAGC